MAYKEDVDSIEGSIGKMFSIGQAGFNITLEDNDQAFYLRQSVVIDPDVDNITLIQFDDGCKISYSIDGPGLITSISPDITGIGASVGQGSTLDDYRISSTGSGNTARRITTKWNITLTGNVLDIEIRISGYISSSGTVTFDPDSNMVVVKSIIITGKYYY